MSRSTGPGSTTCTVSYCRALPLGPSTRICGGEEEESSDVSSDPEPPYVQPQPELPSPRARDGRWAQWREVKVAQLCPTLCDPMDSSSGILQTRILDWVAFPFSRGSSQPRDQTQVSRIAGGVFTNWTIRKDKRAAHAQQEPLVGNGRDAETRWREWGAGGGEIRLHSEPDVLLSGSLCLGSQLWRLACVSLDKRVGLIWGKRNLGMRQMGKLMLLQITASSYNRKAVSLATFVSRINLDVKIWADSLKLAARITAALRGEARTPKNSHQVDLFCLWTHWLMLQILEYM